MLDGVANSLDGNLKSLETVIETVEPLNLSVRMAANPSSAIGGADVSDGQTELLFTPARNRPTIQPDCVCPRLTRAHNRLLALWEGPMDEDPLPIEDITTVDSRRPNLADTIDSDTPPHVRPATAGPSRAPQIPRWYTVSPPRSDSDNGVPRHGTAPLIGSFSEAKKGR